MANSTTALKWCFPPTGGGVSVGFSDASQEFFRSNAWQHTIREIIQNSLDAVDSRRGGPVTVRISEVTIPASEIGANDLASHIRKALERAKEQDSSAGEKFYENALKVLDQNEIKVLAITDTNTTGLVDEKWSALIYDEGTSRKGGMSAAGGSFGIGKSAPYVVSALKTVCYSTRYLGNGRIEKFIARCKISAHNDPKPPFNELQHIGFGTRAKLEKNIRPLPTEGNAIYKIFRLANSGSGIFIMGFDPQLTNWMEVAKKSIARNFFVAIHEKKLEVYINSDHITYDTLDSIFENDTKKEPTRHYYHIIRNNTKKDFVEGKLGKFTVQISIDDEDLPNQIVYINRRGMMITDKRKFADNPFHSANGRGWAKYAAVIMAYDDATDEKIRKMEPPNHQSIEFERINDPKERNSMEDQLRDIKNQIADIITKAISKNNHKRDILLPELADILPFPDDSEKDGVGKNESNTGDLDHRTIKSASPLSPIVTDQGLEPGAEPTKDRTGSKKKSTSSNNRQSSGQGTPVLFHPRIVRNYDKLRVAFTARQNDGKSMRFSVRPVGEERKNEDVIPIISASAESSNSAIQIQNNNVIITPKYNERVVIDLKIHPTKSYTGYEIVEWISDNKPTEGDEK